MKYKIEVSYIVIDEISEYEFDDLKKFCLTVDKLINYKIRGLNYIESITAFEYSGTEFKQIEFNSLIEMLDKVLTNKVARTFNSLTRKEKQIFINAQMRAVRELQNLPYKCKIKSGKFATERLFDYYLNCVNDRNFYRCVNSAMFLY